MNSETFVSKLLDAEKIALMPGSSFGKEADSLIRISLTVPDLDIDTACKRILSLLASKIKDVFLSTDNSIVYLKLF